MSEQNPDTPKNPSVEQLVNMLKSQEAQRHLAAEMAFNDFERAETEKDKLEAAYRIFEMLGMREELRHNYPEIFPSDE